MRGYQTVTLPRKGVSAVTRPVHLLVLETFVGPRPPGMVARHLDGNNLNNTLRNLRWGTPQQNAADRTTHGTQARGETQGLSKLDERQVRSIRAAHAVGATLKELAERYDVSFQTIHYIVRRKTWKHVKP